MYRILPVSTAAYLKHWDKRTYNDLELEAAPLTVNPGKNYRCYHRDIDRLAPFVTADNRLCGSAV